MEFLSKLRLFYVLVHGLIELVVYFTAGPKALDKDPAQPQALPPDVGMLTLMSKVGFRCRIC